MGRKWSKLGPNRAKSGSKWGRNGVNWWGLPPGRRRPIGEKWPSLPKTRLMAAEVNDTNEEGRSPDRPRAGPRSAGSVRAGSRDVRNDEEDWLRFGRIRRAIGLPFGFVFPGGKSSRVRFEIRKAGTSLASFRSS